MSVRRTVIAVLAIILILMADQTPGLGIVGATILVGAVFALIMTPVVLLRGFVAFAVWLGRQF